MRPIGCSPLFANRRIRVAFGHFLALLAMASASSAVAGDESPTPAASNAARSSPNLYLSLGVGDTSIGPTAIASLSVDWAHVLFRVRASRTTSFALDGPPEAAITDCSALIGSVVRGGSFRVHAAAGVGLGATTRRGPQIPAAEGSSPFSLSTPKYEWVRYDNVVNVPIQVGVSLDGKYNGIGLDFVANVNREVSTYGIALTVSGGKMRRWRSAGELVASASPRVSGERPTREAWRVRGPHLFFDVGPSPSP